MLSAERVHAFSAAKGAAERVFAERATLPTAGENMASRVEGAGMTVLLMRLKAAAGYQDLLQAAPLRCFPEWH